MESLAFAELLTLTENQGFIVTFGAPWCAPCKKREDDLKKLAEVGTEGFFPIYSVNYDSLSPSELEIVSSIRALPTTFLVPKDTTLIDSLAKKTARSITGGGFSEFLE